jgi:hypothetical protein
MNETALQEKVRNVDVFARARPEQQAPPGEGDPGQQADRGQ